MNQLYSSIKIISLQAEAVQHFLHTKKPEQMPTVLFILLLRNITFEVFTSLQQMKTENESVSEERN